MPKRKSHTQEILEARILISGTGRIDLKKLWDEEAELDPNRIKQINEEQKANN